MTYLSLSLYHAGRTVPSHSFKKTVYLFGAGVSVPYGLPTLANFFVRAEELSLSEAIPQVERSLLRWTASMPTSRPRFETLARIDLQNLEVLMTYLEMLGQLPRIPDYPGINWLPEHGMDDVLNCISVVLRYPVRTPGIYIDPFLNAVIREAKLKCDLGYDPPPYLSRWTGAFRPCFQSPDAIISLNYDTVVEECMSSHQVDPLFPADRQIDARHNLYGLHGMPLIKLHGSISWLNHSDKICIVDSPVRLEVTEIKGWFRLQATSSVLGIAEDSSEHLNDIEPVIVPPLSNKTVSTWRETWSTAAEFLDQTDRLVIVGFSLPESDFLVRSLLAMVEKPAEILIINPDCALRQKYEALFGSSIHFFGCTGESFLATPHALEVFPLALAVK